MLLIRVILGWSYHGWRLDDGADTTLTLAVDEVLVRVRPMFAELEVELRTLEMIEHRHGDVAFIKVRVL